MKKPSGSGRSISGRTSRDPIPRFGKVVIVVGAPIVPPPMSAGVVPRDRVDAVTADLANELQQVFDDAYDRRDGRAQS